MADVDGSAGADDARGVHADELEVIILARSSAVVRMLSCGAIARSTLPSFGEIKLAQPGNLIFDVHKLP